MQTIPDSVKQLLTIRALAVVSTLGPKGEPQSSPLWFLWRDGAVQISLVEGRQKLKNLRRDPRLTLVLIDPSEPTRYLELRGHIDALVPDPDRLLEAEIAIKYTGSDTDVEVPGAMRYVARIEVDRITMQDGFAPFLTKE